MKKRKSKENSLKLSFRQQLESDILRKFSLILVSALLLIIGSCIMFYILNMYSTLLTEKKKIDQSYYDLKSTVTKSLEQSGETVVLDYLKGKGEERELYATFYKLMSTDDQKREGRFLVLDATFQLVFDSEKEMRSSNKLTTYLETVFSHEETTQGTVERVYLAQDKKHYLIVSKAIIEQETVKGYLAILIDGTSFQPDTSLAGVHYYLYDRYDNVFAMSTPYFLEGNLEKLSSTVKSGFSILDGELILTERSRLSENVNLLVLKQENSVKLILLILFVSMGVLFIVMIIPIKAWARRLAENNSKNVALISEEMTKVGDGSTYRFKITSGDEFETLGENINDMLNRMDSLHQNNLALVQANSVSERKKLEAQFDPHFLYNTLETIRISSLYDPTLANQMILSLNVVLRYSISETVSSSQIKDDLNYLKHYLKIYEARFERLTYDIRVDEAVKELTIPKLLLLPIIENSLKYGLIKRQDLKILIEAKELKNGSVILSVVDNGGGISSEIINAVNQASYKNEENHHGLYNSKRRFLLAYPNSNFTLFSIHSESAVIMEIKQEDRDNV